MPQGIVKWFNVKKGFGFIQGPLGEKDVFVHYTQIDAAGFRALKDGEPVEYEVVHSEKGPQARNVRKVAVRKDQGDAMIGDLRIS